MKTPEKEIHTRLQATIFKGKTSILQVKRAFENLANKEIKRFTKSTQDTSLQKIAESKTELWTEAGEAEKFLLAGKVENLRLAIRKLDGLEIPANQIFSFWKQLGKANRLNGYVVGRELREGCIVPNIGGGLCQISNALYDAALQANFEIIERHAHTQVIAGSLAEKGRDATVFWNYVDLRFRSSNAFQIEARMDANHLYVRFKSDKKIQKPIQISRNGDAQAHNIGSCATCGDETCFRSLKPNDEIKFGKTAFLVDEFSPEFDQYIQKTRAEKDVLLLPIDGKRFKKANYAWTVFPQIKQSFLTTIIRSYKSRKLASQGASRQNNLLEMSQKLAESYAKSLTYDATHLVVQQNLLPFLWKSGHLGGRTFDVLMTALPMKNLQERLNFAKNLHPESETLGDFRAETWLVEAENEALKEARKIITSHTDIASLFPNKTELLNWNLPNSKAFVKAKNDKFTIVFPASTVGRKGVYELREAIRDLDVKLIILGGELEGKDFWEGFDVEKGGENWLEIADLVVLPAFVEHKPRRVLQAIANEIPVVVSKACGLENIANAEVIRIGDAVDLREAIEKNLVNKTSIQLKTEAELVKN
jgi:VanW like protein